MWRQLNILLVCFFGKRTAFIANQVPKDRVVWLYAQHVVTLSACCDCSGEVPNLVGSCLLLLLDTQGPCETSGTAPLPGFLHLKWDLQSWVHSVCGNVKVAWRRHWAFSNLEFFPYLYENVSDDISHLCVSVLFDGWLGFFPTNLFVWLREILNIHDFLVIKVWAWPPVCIL